MQWWTIATLVVGIAIIVGGVAAITWRGKARREADRQLDERQASVLRDSRERLDRHAREVAQRDEVVEQRAPRPPTPSVPPRSGTAPARRPGSARPVERGDDLLSLTHPASPLNPLFHSGYDAAADDAGRHGSRYESGAGDGGWSSGSSGSSYDSGSSSSGGSGSTGGSYDSGSSNSGGGDSGGGGSF